jgi:glyoxylase-like metal-dependent hydrolase (beta-lactamase superfamily II)
VPGHTPGSVAYRVERFLLSGDTLFERGVGRPDLGDRAAGWGRSLYRTLRQRLGALPDDTIVLPAHCAGAEDMGDDGVVSAPLGRLRTVFASSSEDEFVRAVTERVAPPPASYAAIMRANLEREEVPAETATEWELGRNECASR